jgi:hypothetical protein
MGNQITRQVRSTRALFIAVALAGALLGVLVVSQQSSAYGVNYCTGWSQSGTTCTGPTHTITANIAWDGTGSGGWVCEQAINGGGSSVGGWSCGAGEAEGCFPGNQLLRGQIYNATGYFDYVYGTEYYSQGCP